MHTYLEKIIPIIMENGKLLIEIRNSNKFEVSDKYGNELVTSADILLSERIKQEIMKIYPAHEFISEEDLSYSDDYLWDKPTWVLDPIDGTVNFANNQYQVAISLAFIEDSTAKLGIVYNPFLNELFYSAAGEGAYLNGKQIHVKEIHSIHDAVIGTGFPYNKEHIEPIITNLKNILPSIRDIRRIGSAALDICWIACGRLHGYYEGNLKPWDIAAALLIAQEAGASADHYGNVTKLKNIPECVNGNNLIVSSPGIFDDLKNLLNMN